MSDSKNFQSVVQTESVDVANPLLFAAIQKLISSLVSRGGVT